MILHLAPDAPLIARMAAGGALVLHISGGLTGFAAGWTALLARPGGRLHRVAGTVFFVGMLAMAGVGAIVAPMLPSEQWANTSAAVFTLYLIATSWATVRRPAGQVGRFERAALAAPLGLAAAALLLALTPLGSHRLNEATGVAVFAALAGLAATCDLQMIRAGGIRGPARVARHLWRMTLALAIANGSFFLGQPRFVPEILKTTGLNFALPLGVVALLVFWMIRLRWPRAVRTRPVAA